MRIAVDSPRDCDVAGFRGESRGTEEEDMISVSRYRQLFVRSFVLLASLALLAGPVRADAAPSLQPAGQASRGEGSPAPRPRRTGLIVGGVVTFAIPYALGVLAAFSSLRSTNEMRPLPQRNRPGGDLLIPIAGPWMAISASPR